MSTLIYSGTHGSSPRMTYQIYYTATRSGTNVKVTFDITTTLNPYGVIYTLGPVVFYGGSYVGSTQASTTIKNREGDQWGPAGSDGAPRYRSCSFTIGTTDSNMNLYFRVDVGDLSSSHALSEQRVNVSIPPYIAPTAPTWVSINPNPCNINNRPTITWGGAVAGSNGVLVYDVEVASLKPNGGWTEWLRISNSQSSTTYNETVLANMNINGQKPFVGVKYKYRIRSYDGKTSFETGLSAWKESPELTVSFTAPSAPTVRWSASTVKRNKSVNVSWSGASGGSGTITNYTLVVSLVGANQSAIISTKTYTQTSTSKTINVLSEFPSAKNGNYLKANVYTNNSWGQHSSASSSVYTLVKGNQMWIKINGTWKEGECYIKINGTWKEGLPYIKVNGTWKESI